METVFLEATLQLVAPESGPLLDSQANALEALVFDWVLHAEKFVDSKHAELLRARDKVCCHSSISADALHAVCCQACFGPCLGVPHDKMGPWPLMQCLEWTSIRVCMSPEVRNAESCRMMWPACSRSRDCVGR